MTSLRPYENESPAPISRRFFAFVSDAILVIIAHFLIVLAANGILTGSDDYKDKLSILQNEMYECYDLQEEAHLYQYEGEGTDKYNHPVMLDTIFEKWCYQHVLHAFNVDPSYFNEKEITSMNLEGIEEASYENDSLAYFYKYFIEQNNENYHLVDAYESIDVLYYDMFKEKAYYYNDGTTTSMLWKYDDTTYALPTLTSEYAYYIYSYYKVDKQSQMNLATYNLLAKTFQDIWNDEVNILVNSDVYQEHYQAYMDTYAGLSKKVNICSIISYTVAFILVIVLPTILFKSHQTLGKKYIKVQSVDVKGYPVLGWQDALRTILKFFVIFGFCIASNFLAGGGNSAWVYPLFNIGSVGISILTIDVTMLIVALASFVISIFINKKRDIADLICGTYLIDLRYYIPPVEGNIMLMKEEEKASSEDAPVVEIIDSTTIKK